MPRMSYSRKICGLTATAVLSAVVVTRCNSLLFAGEEFAPQVRRDARPRPFAPGVRTPQFQRGCCRQYTGRFGDLSTGAVFIFSSLAYFHLIHQTFTISYRVCN